MAARKAAKVAKRSEDALDRGLRAIANPHRRRILHWLKAPRSHFRRQVDGDLVDDGVCALLIVEKLGLSQPTTAGHLRVLVESGLLRTKRIKQWTFYRRDEAAVEALSALIAGDL